MKTKGKPRGTKGGRKDVTDKKIQIDIYIKTSIIEQNGGKDSVKQELTNYINNKPVNK